MVIQRLLVGRELRDVLAHGVVQADADSAGRGDGSTIAVTAFDADNVPNGESGVADDLRRVGRDPRGPLPRTWPIARSRSTAPSRRTHSAMAGWMPLLVEAPHRFPDAIAGLGRDAHLAAARPRPPTGCG